MNTESSSILPLVGDALEYLPCATQYVRYIDILAGFRRALPQGGTLTILSEFRHSYSRLGNWAKVEQVWREPVPGCPCTRQAPAQNAPTFCMIADSCGGDALLLR